MKKKEGIYFENVNGKRYITHRDNKGKITTRRLQKGSNINTKEYAKYLFKKYNSFDFDKAEIRYKEKYDNLQNIKPEKLKIKGKDKTKTISIKNNNIKNVSALGKNTVLIQSTKPIKKQQYYNVYVEVKFGNVKVEGYSNVKDLTVNEKKEQAFQRALGVFTNKINVGSKQFTYYFYDSEMKTGDIRDHKTGKVEYLFYANYTFNTYINSTMKEFTAQETLIKNE